MTEKNNNLDNRFNPFDLGLFKPGEETRINYSHEGRDYFLYYDSEILSISATDNQFWALFNIYTIKSFIKNDPSVASSNAAKKYLQGLDEDRTTIVTSTIKTFDMESNERAPFSGTELLTSLYDLLNQQSPDNNLILIGDFYSNERSPNMSLNFNEFKKFKGQGLDNLSAILLTPSGKIMSRIGFFPAHIEEKEDLVLVYFARDKNE